MNMSYDDKWERIWGFHFLKQTKGKDTLLEGKNTKWDTRDITDYYSNYGVDVERAQNYNPISRNGDITIPLRKQIIGKYWDNKITDYIQFTDNTHTKLVYIKDETIKKYKDNISWNKTNNPYPREYTWKDKTLEECKIIWNSYIEIPKEEVEIWERFGSKGNWNWKKL